jgi:hypothetical protein
MSRTEGFAVIWMRLITSFASPVEGIAHRFMLRLA